MPFSVVPAITEIRCVFHLEQKTPHENKRACTLSPVYDSSKCGRRQLSPAPSAPFASIRNKAPFEVIQLSQMKMYTHLLKRRSLRQTNEPVTRAGAVLAKGGEGNVQVKTDIISTYSEAESQIPVFSHFSNEELVFRREDANIPIA